jgi:hypothetical protein
MHKPKIEIYNMSEGDKSYTKKTKQDKKNRLRGTRQG